MPVVEIAQIPAPFALVWRLQYRLSGHLLMSLHDLPDAPHAVCFITETPNVAASASFQYVMLSQPQTIGPVVGTTVGFFVHVPPAAAQLVTLQYSVPAQSVGTEGRQVFVPPSVAPELPELLVVEPLDVPPLEDVVVPLEEVVPLDVPPLEVELPDVAPLDDVDELDVSPPLDEPKRSVSLEPPHATTTLVPTKLQQAKSQTLRTGRLRSKVQLRKIP